MIILIDAGNSNVKLALLNDIGEFERISIDHFKALSNSVKQVIYASVKSSTELEQILTHCDERNIVCQQVTVSKNFKQIQCGYPVVDNLGVDRWLAVIAARTIYSETNIIVIDAGTAITVDVCIDNQHLGGWIAPGLKLMQDSIIAKAPGVFSDSNIKSEVYGTDTPSALFHGCIYSLVGIIEKAEQLVKSTSFVGSENTKIVLTGGDANLISKYLTLTNDVHQDLVFIGLKQFINY